MNPEEMFAEMFETYYGQGWRAGLLDARTLVTDLMGEHRDNDYAWRLLSEVYDRLRDVSQRGPQS